MDNSPLGRLARELRDKIWEYALMAPSPVRITWSGVRYFLDGLDDPWILDSIQRSDAGDMLAIRRVCKQIHRETHDMFFKVNDVRLAASSRETYPDLLVFSRFLGPTASAALNHVTVKTDRYTVPSEVNSMRQNLHRGVLTEPFTILKQLRVQGNSIGWKVDALVEFTLHLEDDSESDMSDDSDQEDNTDHSQGPDVSSDSHSNLSRHSENVSDSSDPYMIDSEEDSIDWASVSVSIPLTGNVSDVETMWHILDEEPDQTKSYPAFETVRDVLSRCLEHLYGPQIHSVEH